VVQGTDGQETLGIGGVEASDEGELLARSAAKAAQTVWAINETISGEVPASPLACTEGKPSSEPPDCDVEGTFATSSLPVDSVDIIGVCRLLLIAHEPITERQATSKERQVKRAKERAKQLSELSMV